MTHSSSGEGRKSLTEIIVSSLPGPSPVLIEPDTELKALGVDSISRMHLAIEIAEATGRDVSDKEVLDWETVADVAKALGEGV